MKRKSLPHWEDRTKPKSSLITTTIQAEITELEKSALLSITNINNVLTLINIVKDANNHSPQVTLHACTSTRRLFNHYMHVVKTEHNNDKQVTAWLYKHYATYTDLLFSTLTTTPHQALKVSLAKLLWTDLLVDHCNLTDDIIDRLFFKQLVTCTFTKLNWSSLFTSEICARIIVKYTDIRFYVIKVLIQLTSSKFQDGPSSKALFAMNIAKMIELLPPKGLENPLNLIVHPASHPVHLANQHQKYFSNVVICYLPYAVSVSTLESESIPLIKKILTLTPTKLIPNMNDPRLLMTFLTSCFDHDTSISILALDSIFLLMVHHNLEYQDFYKKLYTLIDRNIFHMKYRSRFFKLVTKCMSSTHIPAYLVAAFIKRITRLALHAPPAGILIVVPLVYNLLKKHPQCLVLIHRDQDNLETDPFIFECLDPILSRAMDSSLWELACLTRHYFPNVATIAQNLFTASGMNRSEFDMADFLDYTYYNLFESVHVPKMKKAPALNYSIPTTLFQEHENSYSFMNMFDMTTMGQNKG